MDALASSPELDAARVVTAPNWTPPPNPDAAAPGLHQWLVHLAIQPFRHPILVMLACIPAALALGGWLSSDRFRGTWRRRLRILGPSLLGMAGFANVVLGGAVSAMLLHRYGVSAAATVVDSYDTGSQDNQDHPIYGHHILIRATEGGDVESYFSDDQLAIYPPVNQQPGQGEVFTVRYLPRHPHELAIMADDESPWARVALCDQLHGISASADTRASFTHATADQAALARAEAEAESAGCA